MGAAGNAERVNGMGNVRPLGVTKGGVPSIPECAAEKSWYAVYTCAHHEKGVARQLELRAVESFLPLYEKVSRWKDRRVRLQLPLFAGYVFVRIALEEKLRVLQIPSVVRLVGFNGIPTPLNEGEMEAMRNGLNRKLHAEPHPFLTVGRRVRIKSGPFAGLQGILVRKKGGFRFVLSVELIQRSIAVDVDGADVLPLVSHQAS
jgi:transcription antitermination factor NusG